MLHESRKETNFLIFEKIILPSSTAFTIVAKLSSTKIIFAVSFATSVPVIPIEIPISAFLIAGASFTPSPVIATISPFSWRAFTSCTLFCGDTLAKTLFSLAIFLISSSVILFNSFPSIAWSLESAIPKSLAIAKAVSK